jgi:hypothetical protein
MKIPETKFMLCYSMCIRIVSKQSKYAQELFISLNNFRITASRKGKRSVVNSTDIISVVGLQSWFLYKYIYMSIRAVCFRFM